MFGEDHPPDADCPACPPIPDVLDLDPERFHPAPLFQGKLFRRIAAIRRLDAEQAEGAETLTDVRMPDSERYVDHWFVRRLKSR